MNAVLDLISSRFFALYENTPLSFTELVSSSLKEGDVILLETTDYKELYYFNGYVFIQFHVVNPDSAYTDRYTPLEVNMDNIKARYIILGNWEGEV